MKAAMYYSNSDVRLEDVPQPGISPDEALLKVEASGICGSDVMEWYRRDKVPLVLGHEVAGRLTQVGARVKGFKINDRIVATHHVPCGRCAYCRDGHSTVCDLLRSTHFYPGGFSEYVRLPAVNLKSGTLKIPRRLTFAEASFAEPLGCVLRGQRLAGMKKGRRVLVIGSGISGLLHVKCARYRGAEWIAATDVDPYRLKMAKKFGADRAFNAKEDVPLSVKKNNRGRLADLVILCSGAPAAVEQGLRSVDRGGTVLIFTAAAKDSFLPLSTNDIFWRTEVKILSSYAASPDDLKEALKLIAAKEIVVKDMITHRLPLEKIQEGFDLVVHPRNSIKVVIEPGR